MSSSFFEVVVVGTELSGLVLAATLAKRGYRVLVLGQGQRRNGYEFEGFPFVRRPDLVYGLPASPAVEAVLAELGLNIELRNRLRPVTPRFQFATPAARVDFDADPAVLGRELEREFPGYLPQLERYLRVMAEENALLQSVLEEGPPVPPEGFFERRAYRRAVAPIAHMLDDGTDPLRDFPKGHPLRLVLSAPLPFIAQPDLASMPRVQWVRAAVHAAQGFYLLEGGLDRLKSLLLDKVVAHCGAYRPDVSVDALTLARGKVRAVGLRRRNEDVGCKLVVCNSDPKRFFQLVPHEHQKERFHNQLRSLQPSHYLATLNLAVRGEVVQEGMCPVVFYVPRPDDAADDENLLLIVTDPRVHGEAEGQPYRTLTVACRISARRFTPRAAFGREVAARLLDRAAAFIPFLDERLLASHLTWLSSDPEADELDMTEVLPLHSGSMPLALDASPLGCRSGYKNILVGGDVVLSGFGLEGAFLAGLTLVRHASRAVVLKSILHE